MRRRFQRKTWLRADKETVRFYFVDEYDGIRAIFDLPLDSNYADPEQGKKLLRATGWGWKNQKISRTIIITVQTCFSEENNYSKKNKAASVGLTDGGSFLV